MPDWQQLQLRSGDPAACEQWLIDHGALAITLQDAGDEAVLEPAPGAMPLWSALTLTALFDENFDTPALIRALQATGLVVPGSLRHETLADRAWERECLRDFGPMRFGHRLWVAPHLDRSELPEDAIVLRLDPGLAFGTGTHPTTRLCLEWLDGQSLSGQSVIDFGCGSGILAIAAARLGAASVLALDHDLQALTATQANAQANAVAVAIAGSDAADALSKPVDVVLANILAGTLVTLAEQITGLVKPGGQLVLSGILAEQSAEVIAAYASAFQFTAANSEAWVRLDGRRFA